MRLEFPVQFPEIDPESVQVSDGKDQKYDVDSGPRIETWRSLIHKMVDDVTESNWPLVNAAFNVNIVLASSANFTEYCEGSSG